MWDGGLVVLGILGSESVPVPPRDLMLDVARSPHTKMVIPEPLLAFATPPEFALTGNSNAIRVLDIDLQEDTGFTAAG